MNAALPPYALTIGLHVAPKRCSFSHLTAEDRRYLNRITDRDRFGRPRLAHRTDSGWICHVLEGRGAPLGLAHALAVLAREGATYVLFEIGAPEIPGLPLYDNADHVLRRDDLRRAPCGDGFRGCQAAQATLTSWRGPGLTRPETEDRTMDNQLSLGGSYRNADDPSQTSTDYTPAEAKAVDDLRAYREAIDKALVILRNAPCPNLPGATWLSTPADAIAALQDEQKGIAHSIADIGNGRARHH